MKIKLVLVLSLLFNFIILNSCGPFFWRQAVEDNKEFYSQLADREILRREELGRKEELQRNQSPKQSILLLSTYIACGLPSNLNCLPCMICVPRLFVIRRSSQFFQCE
ncbi:hypothetical protein E3J79_01595 [Candidatus Dependentiae bacterium]|nr:MAG: hypothetical protein E3J79_01595 [Candidatus Dependentiae bacterium]